MNDKVMKAPIEKVDRAPVVFKNSVSGLTLAGIIYKPRNMPSEKLPGIVIGGPMGSVKELTQSLYAMLLAEQGYVTMVYDNSFVGASEGHPRGYEDPDIKGQDIRDAIAYLKGMTCVDSKRVAAMGICGSGVYVPHAVIGHDIVKAVISVVPFTIMNTVVTASDGDLLKMKADYEAGNEPNRLVMIEPGSEGAEYYYDTDRGASANMIEFVTWSQMTWHKFDPVSEIKDLNVPYLVITAENAFTRQGAEAMFANAKEPKEFVMIKGARHFDMYDIREYVSQNMKAITSFLGKYL